MSSASDPVLETDIGRFVGTLLTFESGVKVDAFYGVPFAKPPVGPLRFEKPQDAEFVEEREAKTMPKVCIQVFSPFEQSEDCLYMNVFRPHEKSDSVGYPGFFYIHGGAYQVGYSHQHTTDYVAEHYAGQGMTVIIPHYRLGIYGFAATTDKAIPGNYGLHDLHQALRFTRRNAKGLYLDNDRITVGGYSAGSAAASALSISPLTHNLFSQVVQFSGSTLAEWAFSKRGLEVTDRVVKILGCAGKDVKECMKSKTVEEIENAAKQAHEFDGEINYFDYSPTIDGDFIPVHPSFLISSAKPKPTLASLNENEGLLGSIYYSGEGWNHGLPKEKKDNFTVEDFKEHIRNTVVLRKFFGDQHEEAAKEVADFYLSTVEPKDRTKEFLLDMYAKAIGDVMFVIPQLREFRHKLNSGWTVYNIMSTYNGYIKRNFPHVEVQKTTHGMDYEFLYGREAFGRTLGFTEEDEPYRKLLVDSIVSFVKTGSPKSDSNPNFEAISSAKPLVYTDLSSEAFVKSPYFGREFEFWDHMAEKYRYDLMSGTYKEDRERVEL
ncbi:unnamed protein product [Bursaphelenchus xylophilus]|nr:unnamed protein product [Bursaphelenchus xylophilus]CAG9118340.1 unnamed protein product [Bursaphelenchus xylophilus]